jgi:hypothetical protein
MDTLKRVRKRDGRCYELAWTALDLEPGGEHFRLVHGKVYNATLDVRMDHAWVVLPDGRVYDPVFNKYFPWRLYAKWYAAVAEVTYTRREAMAAIVATRHYGPWHDPPGAGPPTN